MSANSAPQVFNLYCEIREKLVDFLQKQHPEALPPAKPAAKSTVRNWIALA